MVKALLEVGPVVVGTWWYSGMMNPDKDGLVYPIGNKLGGHAYVLNGVNTNKGLVRIKNSWSRKWGRRGYAWLSIDDLDLLIKDDGEACLATELTKEQVAKLMEVI